MEIMHFDSKAAKIGKSVIASLSQRISHYKKTRKYICSKYDCLINADNIANIIPILLTWPLPMSLLKNDSAACLSPNHRHPSREDATSLCCPPHPPLPTQPRSIIAHGNDNIDAGGGGGGAVYRLLQAQHLQWLDSPRPSYCIRKTSLLSICKAPPWATPVLPLVG